MRNKIVILLFIISVKLSAQSLYTTFYSYFNYNGVAFQVFPDCTYRINSVWYEDDSLPHDDLDTYVINWSEGKIIYKENLLVCKDNKTHKVIIFKRIDNDKLEIINWGSYKNRKDESNRHVGWKNKLNEIVYLDDLLSGNRIFYLTVSYEEHIITKKKKSLRRYSWNSKGEKIEHERIQ